MITSDAVASVVNLDVIELRTNAGSEPQGFPIAGRWHALRIGREIFANRVVEHGGKNDGLRGGTHGIDGAHGIDQRALDRFDHGAGFDGQRGAIANRDTRSQHANGARPDGVFGDRTGDVRGKQDTRL